MNICNAVCVVVVIVVVVVVAVNTVAIVGFCVPFWLAVVLLLYTLCMNPFPV